MHPERRLAPRFSAAVDIEIQGGRGVTTNFSTTGVYFETALPLQKDQAVSIVFPLTHAAPGTRVSCSARVLRVDPHDGSCGIAARYEDVAFQVEEP